MFSLTHKLFPLKERLAVCLKKRVQNLYTTCSASSVYWTNCPACQGPAMPFETDGDRHVREVWGTLSYKYMPGRCTVQGNFAHQHGPPSSRSTIMTRSRPRERASAADKLRWWHKIGNNSSNNSLPYSEWESGSSRKNVPLNSHSGHSLVLGSSVKAVFSSLCSSKKCLKPVDQVFQNYSPLFRGNVNFWRKKASRVSTHFSQQARMFSTTKHCSQIKASPKEDEQRKFISEENIDDAEEKILKRKMKIWEQNIWTVPNFLTVSRICLTPCIGYLVVQQSFTLAGGLFILAGFTDLLDGHIARTWPSQKSAFGSALDPLADKILISTLYVTLSVVDLIPVALTALIFIRDVCLIGAAFYVRYISLPPPITLSRFFDGTNVTMELKPTMISKVNTVIQLALACFTMAAPIFNFVDHPLLHSFWYLTAGTTIWSGLGYVFRKDTYEIYKTTQEARIKHK